MTITNADKRAAEKLYASLERIKSESFNCGRVHEKPFIEKLSAIIAEEQQSERQAAKELVTASELMVLRMQSEVARFPIKEKIKRQHFIDTTQAALANYKKAIA